MNKKEQTLVKNLKKKKPKTNMEVVVCFST